MINKDTNSHRKKQAALYTGSLNVILFLLLLKRTIYLFLTFCYRHCSILDFCNIPSWVSLTLEIMAITINLSFSLLSFSLSLATLIPTLHLLSLHLLPFSLSLIVLILIQSLIKFYWWSIYSNSINTLDTLYNWILNSNLEN